MIDCTYVNTGVHFFFSPFSSDYQSRRYGDNNNNNLNDLGYSSASIRHNKIFH